MWPRHFERNVEIVRRAKAGETSAAIAATFQISAQQVGQIVRTATHWTQRGIKITPPRVPEKVVQQHIVTLLRTFGAHVWILGTARSAGRKCRNCGNFVASNDMGTHQTPGIPDLYAIVPKPGDGIEWMPLWVEVKAEGGKPSPGQINFASAVKLTGTGYVMGGLDDVIGWLLERGIVTDRQVPHYRLPAALGER